MVEMHLQVSKDFPLHASIFVNVSLLIIMVLYRSKSYNFNKYEFTPSIRMMFCIVLVQRKLKQKISQQFPLYHIFLHLSNGPDIAAQYRKKKKTLALLMYQFLIKTQEGFSPQVNFRSWSEQFARRQGISQKADTCT